MAVAGSPKLAMARSPRPNSSKAKKKDTDDYEARPYQTELLDAAIEENTIVNLGTGAGKTFIAVMLIKELSYQILKPFGEEDAKRSVFLVTTVPLVKQQAQYVAMHTGLKVGEYTGSLGVDSWTKVRWHHEFNEHQVLVMTMTIFKNLLLTAYVKLSQVNLLVFDECHHAVKNHDYVVIMKTFKEHIENDDMEIPRILGLTASLIPSKCKPEDLELKIKELEDILCCRSQTARDLQEVAKYATNPTESTLEYKSNSGEPRIKEMKMLLETPVSFLDRFKRDQKTKIYEIVKLYLEDCLHLLLNLGLWCAHDFAVTGLHCIEDEMMDIGDHYDSEWDKSLIYFGRTLLQIFVHKSKEVLAHPEFQKEIPLTPKVKSLFLHLGDSAISSGEVEVSNGSNCSGNNKGSNKLLGIVFVERRTTAVTLCKLLQKKKEEDPDLKHIRCAYIVGHNEGKGGNFLRRDAKMKVKEQNRALDRFRQEKYNLLIATSVLEEGLDVPKCNTVIRFDFPPNFRSYLQSKGRARAKVSTYLLFIDEEEAGKKFADLRNYRDLEKKLQIICRGRHVPEDEDILKRMEELIGPYTPFGMDGPKALLSSSLSLVHKYCQKLPKDRYTILAPEFKQEKCFVAEVIDECIFESTQPEAENTYQSTLTLPKNCPWKETIKGQWMPTRRIADKSAALEAVKKLHEVGELNDHLLPVSKSDDSDTEDELKMEERKIKTAGTEKRSNYYPNKVVPALTDCFPIAGPGNHLYVLLMKEVDSNKIYQSLPNEAANAALGILTRKPLPHLKVPGFSLYDEDKELHVEVVKYHNILTDLSEPELEDLKHCHRILFMEVLRIHATWLEAQFEKAEKNYLIVPLRILPDLSPLEVFIDPTLVKQVLDIERMFRTSSWPCPLERFDNALVETLHRKEMQLCEVKKVHQSITAQSPFPDQSVAPTYAHYFETKYNFQFTDMNQPALECKPLGLKARRIQLLTSRFKNVDGESFAKSTQKSKPVNLFPEQCVLHPLCANFWKLVRCLPSALWRVECSLIADTLRSKIVTETEIGLLEDNSQITTCTNLRGYEDYGFGELTTQKYSINSIGEEEVHTIDVPDFSVLPLRGPDNALCLQALSPKGATDSINLERLEILGDSFLKLGTSVFLFCDRPLAHEGKLTMARTRRVGNLNLYLLATKHRSITDAIFSTTFEPRQMWIPPCFVFNQDDPHLTPTKKDESSTPPEEPEISSDQQRHYLYHKLTDKGVADCVESLIGAYLVSGGIEAALKFMKWMGIKITQAKATEGCNSASMSSTESSEASSHSSFSIPPLTKRPKIASVPVPLFVQNSSAIFSEYFEAPKTTSKQVEVERLLNVSCGVMELKSKISWEFKDRSLLLEALTHASYTKNRVTDCFQRLEFLGDAVLDYLVTCHIYSTFPKFDPGRISGMRSALVNNITFAELSVQLGLHKALLHNSPSLFKHIGEYMGSIERMNGSRVYSEAADTEIFCFDESEDSSVSDMDTTPGPSVPIGDENDSDIDDDVIEIDPPKVLGDILESLAGAIFLDSGMDLERVWEVFRPLFDKKIRSFNGEIPVSPIHKLFEKEPDLKFDRQRSVRGHYRCTITVLNKDIKVSATANTKKGAKNAAAKAVLEKLNRRIEEIEK